MAKLHKAVELEIHISPEELARLFCAMYDDEQASFFNEVYEITQRWDNLFSAQAYLVKGNPKLSAGGREVMNDLGWKATEEQLIPGEQLNKEGKPT